MKFKLSLMIITFFAIFLSAQVEEPSEKNHTLTTVDSVDLERYTGRWYEIARLPNRFQKKCAGNVTATYALREDGRIDVTNRCLNADGSMRESKGIARVTEPETNAKLEVSFVSLLGFHLFWGDYWIIGLAEDYSWAIVGNPSRKYGWILSRTVELPEDELDRINRILDQKGYDPAEFQKTKQRPHN